MSDVKRSVVQSNEISYSLHSLGWKAFQSLSIAIVSEVWGQVVQSFADSNDGGRDGAFRGVWKPSKSDQFSGNFTVQCKFTSKPNKSITISDIAEELIKAKRLSKNNLAENYLLFTNAKLTGVTEEKMRVAFESVQGIKRFAGFGGDRISQFIRESPRLRMLVPRVYGLGDLSQILDERAYAQATEILSALGDDLAKFVITDAFKQSAKALVEHGFVLLLGEPACGKSTIAASLAVGVLDEQKCFTIKVRDADDFVRCSNPHEPKQLFWVDDAFGQTQFDLNSVTKWNSALPHMHAAIKRGAKVIFTSRNYIYRSARNFLKVTAFPLLNESQVVIKVENLSKEEKEQILYNHIRLGKQLEKFKTSIKPFLPKVAAHLKFSPEIARRLGGPIFTKNLWVSETGLNDFVERPMDFLCDVIRTIDVESRAALALIFIRNGSLESPIEFQVEEKRALELLGGSISGVLHALNALEGSLVNFQTLKDGRNIWSFKHPTIRDAFASLIVENREWLDIYLAGTPLNTIFGEVSCGVVDIEGVKLIVPAERYDSLITRILNLNFKKSQYKNELYYFLARRCNKEFLEQYIHQNPNFITELQVGSYFYAVSDVNVLVRLNELGLLPEQKRLLVIEAIKELAVETPDAGFVRDNVKSLFTEIEFEEMLDHVRKTLIPKLNEHIDSWRTNFHMDDPDSYFGELEDAFDTFKEVFEGEDINVQEINSALTRINQVKEELRSNMPDEKDEDSFFKNAVKQQSGEGARLIFDDVDE